MRLLIASEGEPVTCERGHAIATINRDVPRGLADEALARSFTFAPGVPEPDRGTRLPLRCSCGAPWLKSVEGTSRAIMVHVSGGWR